MTFTNFFNEKGVIHQFSCVEKPQQNSDVERKHQNLLNVARALYFQSQLLLQFWTHCILTAVFLINRTPSSLLQNKTPYELLYHKKVEYSLFCVFGCLAFAFTLSAHRTKFQPWARMCAFFGYPIGMKGYRLYNIQAKQVFVSRDVIFHEEVFPFHFITDASSLVDPFPDLVLPNSFIDLPDISSSSHESATEAPCQVAQLPSILSQIPEPIRRSFRQTKPPSYLRDFHCNLARGSSSLLP